jgi:hypothetical protein
MMEFGAFDGPERRHHTRISYILSQRPLLKVQNHKLEIVDFSAGGIRTISNPNVTVFDKPLIHGTIDLLGGDNIDIQAESAWIMGDETRLKFRNLIPIAVIRKEREKSLNILIEQIVILPGGVNREVLHAIVDQAHEIEPIENSVETGSGRTTLLFSYLSKSHLVFAKENGNKSISSVKKSDLFNAKNVTFIEGPTQRTLPQYSFTNKFDIVLIDGPHGYPFPDIEYYYFYPNLIEGGLLLVDDIQIPSIRRMFDIIKADDMFELLDVLNDMAFFRRTDSPLIDPYSDSWWLQGYNKGYYDKIKGDSLRKKKLANMSERIIPEALKKYMPNSLKAWIRSLILKLL